MRIREEIKAVGFKDWFWFVFVLKRNEFSKKLSTMYYYKKYGHNSYQHHLVKDRQRAHDIDMKLDDLPRRK
jgi:hypothetical protein